ncbi:MAG: ribbon-helix-helix domain-containing protein [Candidatus Bathyarchaeia archaeon]
MEGEGGGRRYLTVSIPKGLIEEVDRLVGSKGYRSRAEVVVYALRRLLEESGRGS